MTQEIERLVGLLTALSHDCENTDGWEAAAPDLRAAADALTALIKRERELREALDRTRVIARRYARECLGSDSLVRVLAEIDEAAALNPNTESE